MEQIERFKKAVEYLKTKAKKPTNEEVSRLLRYKTLSYISDVIGGSKPINDLLLDRMVENSINKEWVETGKGKMLIEGKESKNENGTKYIKITTALGTTVQVTAEGQSEIALLNAFLEERDRAINDLQSDKINLQNTIDTNLTAMMQLLGALSRHDRAFHETMLKSLARIEKRQESELVGEARSFEAAKQLEEQTRGKLKDEHK